jgi:hypothetical protein
MNKIITFEDKFQDFLTFEVTPKGKIVDVQPFQYSIWSKFSVTNVKSMKVGGFVNLKKGKEEMTIKYPIEKIENKKKK